MKYTPLILLLFIALCASAQTPKGLSAEEDKNDKPEGKTYALIVGISKYKNPAIPQLQFADRDAIAFRNYLVESGVDSNNIILRINENAMYADIMLDLDALCNERTKAGDRVFIYFSGHGDVESRVITHDGYLLPYNTTDKVYSISALQVQQLQSFVATLSAKGVEAIVIVDACHAGNLAGGIEGLKNIEVVLKESWKDEIKILSCQPGELSLEAKQWGGGRGLFSYELVNGLAGAADKNKDGKVSLRELNLYLMEKVPEEASPMSQNPMVFGNMEAKVTTVNQRILTEMAAKQGNNTMTMVDVKGFDASILKELNDTIVANYKSFKACLDTGNLVLVHGLSYAPSAAYYYIRVPENGKTKILVAIMKRNISAAIINDLQLQVSYGLENKFGYAKTDVVLFEEGRLLRNILGDDKLIHFGCLALYMFFEARAESNYKKTMGLLDSAIQIDPNAAYIYNWRANCYEWNKEYEKSISDRRKAIQISPRYGTAYWGLALTYTDYKKTDSALLCFNRLIELDTNFQFSVNLGKAQLYNSIGNADSAHFYYQIALNTTPLPNYKEQLVRFKFLSHMCFAFKDYESSIKYSLIYIADNPDYLPALFSIIISYAKLNDKSNALIYFKRALDTHRVDYESIRDDEDLNDIKAYDEFKPLMKKYFPDQYKE